LDFAIFSGGAAQNGERREAMPASGCSPLALLPNTFASRYARMKANSMA
jgi:hypothetical protein